MESVSGVIGQDDGLTGGQLTSGMPMIPERLTDGGGPKTTNSGNYPLHSGNYVTTIESIFTISAHPICSHTPSSNAQADLHQTTCGKNSSPSDPISTDQTGIHCSLISTGK